MANPNIVNVTAIYGITTYLTPSGTSAVVLVANPANSGKIFKINQLTAANVTNVNANGAVWLEKGILYGSNDRDTAAEFQIQLVGVTELLVTDLIL